MIIKFILKLNNKKFSAYVHVNRQIRFSILDCLKQYDVLLLEWSKAHQGFLIDHYRSEKFHHF